MADLAAEASRTLGLGEAEALTVRRAGLLHDLGRLGVSNAVWDRRGKLTQAGAERVRLHPYLTERMLAFSPALAALGPVAVQHHERLDGSGYPRGRSGDAITPAGRILGAADGTPLGRGQRGERMQGTPKTLHGRAVWLAWGAVAGVVVFNLGWLLAGTVQGAGYSVASHDVSDLGALTARFPWGDARQPSDCGDADILFAVFALRPALAVPGRRPARVGPVLMRPAAWAAR